MFAAVVFALKAGDAQAVGNAAIAFVLFCAASSGVYLFNDILDRDLDRKHPLKRERPIASGTISVGLAACVSALLVSLAVGCGTVLGVPFTLTVVAYLVIQILYSLVLKRLVIIDVLCVAFGFVLRAVAGALAVDVAISPWLLICSFSLALLLALGKRRHEVVLLELSAREHRASLTEYSPYFLDQMIGVMTSTTVVAYALYTLSQDTVGKFGTHYMVLTLPFVIYGVFRYLYLVHQKHEGGNPTKLFLTDWAILVNTALWLLAAAVIVYR